MGFLKHTAFWEGPCRGGAREDMTPEAENARCDMLFEKYCKSLEDMPAEINILEPLAVPYYENFMLTEEQEAEIRRELADVDYIMVMNQRIPKIERFKKPIISYTHAVSAADTPTDNPGYVDFIIYDPRSNRRLHMKSSLKIPITRSLVENLDEMELDFVVRT